MLRVSQKPLQSIFIVIIAIYEMWLLLLPLDVPELFTHNHLIISVYIIKTSPQLKVAVNVSAYWRWYNYLKPIK